MSNNNTLYPYFNRHLPFSDYICQIRRIINDRRPDLQQFTNKTEIILNANSPFALYPHSQKDEKATKGVLFIHGLLDCPFTFRDIANQLQKENIVCKAILLPGHGTQPKDLLSISYQQWIDVVQYGINSLRDEVEQIYLAGYSTGAALAIHQAFIDNNLAGIILLAPAVQIKVSMNIINGYHYIKTKLQTKQRDWIILAKEIDYTKYKSIPFNAVKQVENLIHLIKNQRQQYQLKCPIFMSTSYEDETISSEKAIQFFLDYHQPKSKLILYHAKERTYADNRIRVRNTHYPELQIKTFSHIALPFSPDNFHYGLFGDYPYASRIASMDNSENKNIIYGAFDGETFINDLLHQFKLTKKQRRVLTYNPDFHFLVKEMLEFIRNAS